MKLRMKKYNFKKSNMVQKWKQIKKSKLFFVLH